MRTYYSITFLKVILPVFVFLIFSSFILDKKPKHPFGRKFKVPKTYVYIPSGELYKNPDHKIKVLPFFMSSTEITNQQYNEFLADLKQQGKTEAYEIAQQHPDKWRERPHFYGEPFVNHYPTHPAYNEYPVLAISKEGAELYCQWLTEKLQPNYPKHEIKFRLPTENEWEYAARGGHQLAPYPWGGYYLRNAKGCFLANFKTIGTGNIHTNRKTNEYEVIVGHLPAKIAMPVTVKSYFPNDYGLYNMVGNAAEMLSTKSTDGKGNRTKGGCFDSTGYDIKIDAADEFEGWTEPSPFIGFRTIMDVVEK